MHSDTLGLYLVGKFELVAKYSFILGMSIKYKLIVGGG